MNKQIICFLPVLLLSTLVSYAQLAVDISPLKLTGNKALVVLEMKNRFLEPVQSARATVFLVDEHGKMVGESAKWVIGCSPNKPPLPAGKTNNYNFILTPNKTNTSTNLTAKVTFDRVLLEGGKLANATKDVTVKPASK